MSNYVDNYINYNIYNSVDIYQLILNFFVGELLPTLVFLGYSQTVPILLKLQGSHAPNQNRVRVMYHFTLSQSSTYTPVTLLHPIARVLVSLYLSIQLCGFQ